MKAGVMRARNLLLTVCAASCLGIACGGDDDDSPPGNVGDAGEAGAPSAGSSQGGSAGKGASGSSAGKAGSPVGEAGEPSGGMPPVMPGAAGMGGESPTGFVDFVHDLLENHTSDAELPARTDQQFTEARDDHGHYQTPDAAFEDLF